MYVLFSIFSSFSLSLSLCVQVSISPAGHPSARRRRRRLRRHDAAARYNNARSILSGANARLIKVVGALVPSKARPTKIRIPRSPIRRTHHDHRRRPTFFQLFRAATHAIVCSVLERNNFPLRQTAVDCSRDVGLIYMGMLCGGGDLGGWVGWFWRLGGRRGVTGGG